MPTFSVSCCCWYSTRLRCQYFPPPSWSSSHLILKVGTTTRIVPPPGTLYCVSPHRHIITGRSWNLKIPLILVRLFLLLAHVEIVSFDRLNSRPFSSFILFPTWHWCCGCSIPDAARGAWMLEHSAKQVELTRLDSPKFTLSVLLVPIPVT